MVVAPRFHRTAGLMEVLLDPRRISLAVGRHERRECSVLHRREARRIAKGDCMLCQVRCRRDIGVRHAAPPGGDGEGNLGLFAVLRIDCWRGRCGFRFSCEKEDTHGGGAGCDPRERFHSALSVWWALYPAAATSAMSPIEAATTLTRPFPVGGETLRHESAS
jgi:hypothetical protein